METNWAWMTETDNSFHTASSLCHIPSTKWVGEGLWAILSATHGQIFSMDCKSGHRAAIGKVLRKVRTQCATCGLALFSWKMESVKPRGFSTMTGHKLSEMYRSAFKLSSIWKLEMSVPCTQWLPKPSQQVKGPYADIKCKQVMNGFLGAFRHVYGHQNTACRTLSHLKRHCVTSLSNFVNQCTRIAISLCYIVKWSRSNGHHADSPCCCKLRHIGRADIGHAENMAIFWLKVHDMVWFCRANLTICLSSRVLRSCMLFSMSLSNSLIP